MLRVQIHCGMIAFFTRSKVSDGIESFGRWGYECDSSQIFSKTWMTPSVSVPMFHQLKSTLFLLPPTNVRVQKSRG